MARERKSKQDVIGHLLDEANDEIIIDRIQETLQVDSETLLKRDEIAQEVEKLNVRRRSRKNLPKRPSR